MAEREVIFDGKEKKIYATEDPDVVCIHYKDITTAFGGIKQAVIKGKGKFTNRISAIALQALGDAGIRTHFIKMVDEREQLCSRIDLIPLQFVVRNRLAGTTAKMLGVRNGTKIPNVIYEMRYNCDSLADPMINDDHAVALGLATYGELEKMHETVKKVNEVLKALFHKAGIELIDFKLEFGRASDGEIIVSDEISPDNSRLWDEQTGRILDKDRFRHDLSDVTASYREVMERLIKISEK